MAAWLTARGSPLRKPRPSRIRLHIFYSTSGDEVDFLTWLGYVLNQQNAPQTISTSYGDEEQEFSRDYATELCLLSGVLGLRGTTLLFASGDDGVGRGDCIFNDSSGRFQFPIFPASCMCDVFFLCSK
jgi:hypothetical protein